MIPVVFSSDHNFIMPTGVAVQSMLESAPNVEFDIFIIQNDDVTDSDRNVLRHISEKHDAKITFLSAGTEFAESYEVRDITIASYYRLLIPWLIPDYDWIIYLDGDIIIKSDISKIINYAIDPTYYVYGVRTPGFSTDSALMKYIVSIGLDPHNYINGGIQVINARLIRNAHLREVFLSFSTKKLLYQDQDIINIVCKDRIGWLPIKFNCTPSLEDNDKNILIEAGITTNSDFEEACVKPVVIHYAGKKPWKTFTYHWYDWWAVYSRTPFYDPQFASDAVKKILNPHYSVSRLIKMLVKKILRVRKS